MRRSEDVQTDPMPARVFASAVSLVSRKRLEINFPVVKMIDDIRYITVSQNIPPFNPGFFLGGKTRNF